MSGELTVKDWRKFREYARSALRMYESSNWIQRTVETVTLLESSELERSVTLDVDLAEFGGHPTFRHSAASLAIPIMKVPKSLLLDLDVRDASGRVLHLLTSQQDSARAQLIMMAKLEEHGHPVNRLDPEVVRALWQAEYGMPTQQDIELLGTRRRTAGQRHEHLIDAISLWRVPKGVRDQWRELLRNSEFARILVDFTRNFTPLVVVPAREGTQVVKIRHIEIQVPREAQPPIGQRLGVRSQDFRLEAPSVGSARREHLRFIAPPGMFIENILPYLAVSPGLAKDSGYVEVRHTPHRAILYTRNIGEGDHSMIARLRPLPSSFVRPVQFTVFATGALLVAGATYQGVFGTLSEHVAQSGPTTTILLVAPSAASAYLVRQGEHDLLNRFLRIPRMLVVASIISVLIASASLALNLHPLGLIWGVCGTFSMVIWLLFRLISFNAGQKLKGTIGQSDRTISFHL